MSVNCSQHFTEEHLPRFLVSDHVGNFAPFLELFLSVVSFLVCSGLLFLILTDKRRVYDFSNVIKVLAVISALMSLSFVIINIRKSTLGFGDATYSELVTAGLAYIARETQKGTSSPGQMATDFCWQISEHLRGGAVTSYYRDVTHCASDLFFTLLAVLALAVLYFVMHVEELHVVSAEDIGLNRTQAWRLKVAAYGVLGLIALDVPIIVMFWNKFSSQCTVFKRMTKETLAMQTQFWHDKNKGLYCYGCDSLLNMDRILFFLMIVIFMSLCSAMWIIKLWFRKISFDKLSILERYLLQDRRDFSVEQEVTQDRKSVV